MGYSCVVVILFNMSLYKSAFSDYFFGKPVFHLFVFCVFCLLCFEFDVIFKILYNIFAIIVYIGSKCSIILFSVYKNYKNVTTVLSKTSFWRGFEGVWTIAPWMIAPHGLLPPGQLPPREVAPRIISPDNCFRG